MTGESITEAVTQTILRRLAAVQPGRVGVAARLALIPSAWG